MKKIICLMLTLALLSAALPAFAANRAELGKPFQDFTVTTIDGEEFTLSEALKTHEAVYVNLFATWCGPCGMEFPYLQMVYEEYSGRVAVIVISIENNDTPDKLRSYRNENGLTLPMAPAGSDWLAQYTEAYSIPVSMVIDRFGNLALRHTGAVTDADAFRRMFDAFLGDGYTGTATYEGIPKAALNVEFPSDEALSAALNVAGGAIAFTSDPARRDYPFVPTERDGQAGVSPSNMNKNNSTASCRAMFTAQAGDALAFDLSCDLAIGTNYLSVELDGAEVKQFMGRQESRSWALALPEGEHEVRFVYDQWAAQDTGAPFVSRVRLLSGAEAEAALAAVPVYPAFDATGITVANEDAQPGAFTYMGQPVLTGCMVSGETADLVLTVTEELDPESVLFLDTSKPNDILILSSLLTADGTGYGYRMDLKAENGESLFAVAALESLLPRLTCQLLVMAGEEGVQQVIDEYARQGYVLTWVPETAGE